MTGNCFFNPFGKYGHFCENIGNVGLSAGLTIGNEPHLIPETVTTLALKGSTRVSLTDGVSTRSLTPTANLLSGVEILELNLTDVGISEGYVHFLKDTIPRSGLY